MSDTITALASEWFRIYANSFSYQILKRYVDVFSEVTVLARNREVDDNQIDLPLASGEGVSFVFFYQKIRAHKVVSPIHTFGKIDKVIL